MDSTPPSRAHPLLWYARRSARRVRSALLAPVFWDRHREPSRSVAVIGTARSGTTWLGDLLAAGLKARVVFEPFHPVHVPEAARFGLMPYRAPEDPDTELLEFCRLVFSGRLRNGWVDRQANRILPAGRVVKCVRANLIAAWLRHRLPEVPAALLVRHPAAVVLSRMEVGWDPALDLGALLADARLGRDHLAGHLDWARSLATEEERNALIWAIHYRVALRQRDPAAGVAVVFYEDLRADPDAGTRALFERLGRPGERVPGRYLRRPSSTARTHGVAGRAGAPDRWPHRLGGERLGRVRAVVERLGLDWLYGPGAGPTAVARARLGHGAEGEREVGLARSEYA